MCFNHVEISAAFPLSSPKKYYSTHLENKRDIQLKNLQYETCKKIYLPRISIKSNLKLSKWGNLETSESIPKGPTHP